MFALWMKSFGVYGETDTDPYGDVDGDTFASLYEYGVGGNPADPENSGVAPKMTRIVQDGETNYIEYVHVRRYSPANSVSVHPETTSNLITADWTNAHYEVVSSAPIDNEFEIVTNRIDTIDPVRMIRLKVE